MTTNATQVSNATEASPIELAAPFLLTILIIFVSTFVIHEVVIRLTDHYKSGWGSTQLKTTPPDRSPISHGTAAVWAIDAALLPTIVGAPVIGLLILRHVYTSAFLIIYAVLVVLGIGFFFYFLRRVRIQSYADRGVKLVGYRFSPLALGGMTLNLICAGAAAFLVH